MTGNVKSGYALIRVMAPVCMQVAFSDPMLWPRDPASNGISFAHALLPPRREIHRFITMDNLSALLFGLPLLLEYDLSFSMIETEKGRPTDWVHGCPNRFLYSIARINQWRERRTNRDPLCIEIEEDAWAWRTESAYDPDADSGKHTLRVAVQEGWRHTVLIYLYMGMCEVTSHDPRVQSSVRQISRLYTIIQSNFAAGMMAPVLVAAACAQSEADRARFHALVSHSGSSKIQLLKNMNFAGVLDHLWQGAAANGAPVTWEDYLTSRRAVIDVGA
ncbi:Fungal specific transcription factor domain [Ceratobasidium sp. AG-Ba]|nr:Fungal specific transcription factor domain [Ceratobasidium sp. AG-Ba]QRW11212.1 Fungal specific transcription factor domain [Ceratobasidium sp. AG-Ba]